MEPLRVGVVGVGNLGEHHARLYAAMGAEGVVLAGVADARMDRATEIAGRFGTRAYPDAESLASAEGIHAASVVVPTPLHHSVASGLLARGIHLLVEKPITSTLDHARELVEAAGRRGLVLQVGHVERYNAAVEALARLRDTPRFIEVDRLSPFPPRPNETGVVLDLMIHDLDLVLELVRSPVREIRASGVPILSATEDIANARIEFEDGCVANLTASRVSMDRLRKIRVFQRDAYLSMDYIKQEIVMYSLASPLVPGQVPSAEQIKIEKLPIAREEPLKQELADFVACVRDRRQGGARAPRVGGREGMRALELALTVERLAREARARDPVLSPSR